MKKFFLITATILSVISCNTDIVEMNDENVLSKNANVLSSHHITEDDALDIASKVFTKTRVDDKVSVEYVLNKTNSKTRAVGISDTLAYIFNYGESNGFAVIASDNRVNPILAYSERGQFKYEEDENNIVYANFISLIDDYLATVSDNDTTVIISDDYLSTCVVPVPLLKTNKWDQREPYDKYVIEEHPGCPVGCVAVAAGQIMINCKEVFYYHDSLYRCRAIRKALENGGTSQLTRIVGGDPDSIKYSYETAIDYVAKLLYWLGKDLNMSYTPSASGTTSYAARKLLVDLGYGVNENMLIKFSDMDLIQRIDEHCLIYVDGRVVKGGSGGHAWIIDGYGYCYDMTTHEIMPSTIKFHCDWGWGGRCNGYYSGDVFATTIYTFGNMVYFSVKM